MKTGNFFIISFIFLVGVKEQIVAQTVHKAEAKVEQKEIKPAKEPEIKEAAHSEAIAQPIQHTEITPVKETEIRQETQTEVVAPATPVEEPKPTIEKTEWVKTEPQPEASKPEPKQVTAPGVRNALLNRNVTPAMKRVSIKPLIIDSTKK